MSALYYNFILCFLETQHSCSGVRQNKFYAYQHFHINVKEFSSTSFFFTGTDVCVLEITSVASAQSLR